MKKFKVLILIFIIFLASCASNKIITEYGSIIEYNQSKLKAKIIIFYQSHSFLIDKLNEKYGEDNLNLNEQQLENFRNEIKLLPKGGILEIRMVSKKKDDIETSSFLYQIQVGKKYLRKNGNKKIPSYNFSTYKIGKQKKEWVNSDKISFVSDFIIDELFDLIIINIKNSRQKAFFKIYPNQIKK